jgi:hypothetical protein
MFFIGGIAAILILGIVFAIYKIGKEQGKKEGKNTYEK